MCCVNWEALARWLETKIYFIHRTTLASVSVAVIKNSDKGNVIEEILLLLTV